MNYLLDTNAAIALINHHPQAVRRRFTQSLRAGDEFAMSSIVAFELWFGEVEKSKRWKENAEALRRFLSGAIAVTPFEAEDAHAAAQIRSTLEKGGIPIGPYDLLIAAQAVRSGTTLITANVKEYKRVAGLTFEDWSR